MVTLGWHSGNNVFIFLLKGKTYSKLQVCENSVLSHEKICATRPSTTSTLLLSAAIKETLLPALALNDGVWHPSITILNDTWLHSTDLTVNSSEKDFLFVIKRPPEHCFLCAKAKLTFLSAKVLSVITRRSLDLLLLSFLNRTLLSFKTVPTYCCFAFNLPCFCQTISVWTKVVNQPIDQHWRLQNHAFLKELGRHWAFQQK